MRRMRFGIFSHWHAGIMLLPVLACGPARAVELPLWEIGAGAAGLTLPDYRGADESESYLLPVPYLVYRGDVVRADRGGIRGTLFERERVQVNISINGTPPARSRNNAARRGMDDLKPVFEIGPTVDLGLWRSPDHMTRLDFRAPLRAAVTAQSSPRHVGWLFSPGLNLNLRNVMRLPGWNANLVVSALFSDRRYHTHFYGVDATQATADRPAYRVGGGYGGTQITLSVSKRFPAFWVGGFVRQDAVAGAAFADSPLVRKHHNVSAGVALIWVMKQSSATVDAADLDRPGEPAY